MKTLNMLVMSVCVLFLFSVPAMAQENLDNWESWSDGTGEFTSSTIGTSARLTACSEGDENWTWGALYKEYPGMSGMMASFNVSEISGTARTGFWKTIGNYPNGNEVIMQIYLDQWDEQKRVGYRIREREPDTREYVRVISRGYLGGLDGSWEEGQDLMLAFLFLDNEIWLASSTTQAFVKIMLWDQVTISGSDFYVYAESFGAGQNSVDVSVSNLSVF